MKDIIAVTLVGFFVYVLIGLWDEAINQASATKEEMAQQGDDLEKALAERDQRVVAKVTKVCISECSFRTAEAVRDVLQSEQYQCTQSTKDLDWFEKCEPLSALYKGGEVKLIFTSENAGEIWQGDEFIGDYKIADQPLFSSDEEVIQPPQPFLPIGRQRGIGGSFP